MDNELNKEIKNDENISSEDDLTKINEPKVIEEVEEIERETDEEKIEILVSNENEEKNEISDSDKDNKSEEIVEENKIPIEPTTPKKKRIILIIIPIILIIVISLFLSSIFAIINLNNKKIISGVHISGIDVSNLSKEEASKKITENIDSKLSNPIILFYGEYEIQIVPEQFDVKFDLEPAIEVAYSKGRSNNIFRDNFEILNLFISKYEINPSFSYSEDMLDSLINEMQSNIPGKLIQPNYYIEGNNLIITSGQNGIKISSNELKNSIINYISNLTISENRIEIPVTDEIAEEINIDKIYSEVYKEATDAYYTTNPFVVYPHADGIDFAISIDEAKSLLNEQKESYTIPLKVLSPNVTTNQIGTEAFPDLIASFSTTYSTSNTNRSTNIRLATNKINGIVIMPGETFSYNNTVGKRTAEAGFKSAPVYSGGQVTTGIGGGICQVSSTLYNAVLLANLEIVERQNHGFNPGYVKAGTDATVSWGGPDFKFKNSRNYPIKVVCTAERGTILFKLFGLKEETEYEVVIESTITSYISPKTIEQKDPTLPIGQTKVLEKGSSGCRTVTYRILKLNGEVVSKTLLSKDTYNPHNKVVAVGTKEI